MGGVWPGKKIAPLRTVCVGGVESSGRACIGAVILWEIGVAMRPARVTRVYAEEVKARHEQLGTREMRIRDCIIATVLPCSRGTHRSGTVCVGFSDTKP